MAHRKRRPPIKTGPRHFRDGWRMLCGVSRAPGVGCSNKSENVSCQRCLTRLQARIAKANAANVMTVSVAEPATNGAATHGPATNGAIDTTSTSSDIRAALTETPGLVGASMRLLRSQNDYLHAVLDDLYAHISRADSLGPAQDYVKRLILSVPSPG